MNSGELYHVVALSHRHFERGIIDLALERNLKIVKITSSKGQVLMSNGDIYVYVSSGHSLRGLKHGNILFWAGSHLRPDYQLIREQADQFYKRRNLNDSNPSLHTRISGLNRKAQTD